MTPESQLNELCVEKDNVSMRLPKPYPDIKVLRDSYFMECRAYFVNALEK